MTALLFALLALDMGGAARELARNVAAFAARDPLTLDVQNLSTLGPNETAAVRREFESELRGRGAHIVETAPTAAVRLTISQNLTHFLLVAELRRGDEFQVLLESWPRVPVPSPSRTQVTLEKKLLWEQEQPILDAVRLDDGVLVLDASRILLVRGQESQSVPIPTLHTWPRDMRGRMLVKQTELTVWLPGAVCQGVLEPKLSAACRESQEPWPLAPGATAVFSPDHNFFAGHVTIESGAAHDVPPFYSAAPAGDLWLFAGEGGRTRLYTRSWEPGAILDHWGAELAGVQTPCGPRILATRPTGPSELDAVLPFEVVEGVVTAAGPPQEFAGSITALWAAGSSAVAVSHDLQTGRYAAFSLAAVCGS